MRWITRDPSLFEGGVNVYEYVGGNPVMKVDPSGLNPIDEMMGGIGDFYRNWKEMRDKNTKGIDKFYHCMAHCESSRRGNTGTGTAYLLGECREVYGTFKGDPKNDADADRQANWTGIEAGVTKKSCEMSCAKLK